jgi:hypothetical protein
MIEHYQQQFLEWAVGRHWLADRLVFDTELVFIVKRKV